MKNIFNKYLNLPIAAKAAIWFIICSVLQKSISVITVPIFTRIMSPEEYGIYSTYTSVYSIFVIICTLSMEKCAYVNSLSKENDINSKDRLAVSMLSLSTTITFFVFIVYLALHQLINKITGLTTELSLLMFVQILFVPPVVFWSTKQRFEYKYIALVLVTLFMVLLNAGLGIVFIVFLPGSQSFLRILSLVLVQLVFGISLYIYYYKKAKKVFLFISWKEYLVLQLPLLPHSLSLTILSSSDRIMINNLIGKTEAAIYSVAYSAGYMVTILKDSISSAMTPWIYEKIKKGDMHSIKKTTRYIMILVLSITFLFVSFAPEVVYILAPQEYYEAVYVIPPVAASSFFIFLYNMFSIIGFYYEQTRKIMYASLIGAALNLILNYIFIPIFGYIAAGYTTLICYIVLAFCHYLIMKSICKTKQNNQVPFDLKFIFFTSIVVIILTIFFSFVYSNWIIRYSILTIILLGIFFFRKKILILFSNLKNKI